MNFINPLLESTGRHWERVSSSWKKVQRNLDENGIHDLRVSTRRIAAALTLLHSILEDEESLKVRRRFKKLQKRLGSLRDVQVQISLAREWKGREPLEKFVRLLKREEKREGRRVLDYLTGKRRKRTGHLLKVFQNSVESPPAAAAPGLDEAKLIIALQARRAELDGARAGFARSDPESLHRLRIAAKKLRYSLEAAAPLLGNAPDQELELLRDYQTKLGDIRDLQILEKELRDWANKQPTSSKTAVLRVCTTLKRRSDLRTQDLTL